MTKFLPILYRRDVKKYQTNYLNRTDLRNRIELIDNWASELKPKKLVEAFQSSFKTLNSRARYPYYWDDTTTTHEKFLTFLITLKRLFLSDDVKHPVYEDFYSIFDRYIPLTGTTCATLYYIFHLYNIKYLDLYPIDYDFRKIDYDNFKNDIQRKDWILLEENMELIKKFSKKAKKTPNKDIDYAEKTDLADGKLNPFKPKKKSKAKKEYKCKKRSKLSIIKEVFS